MKHVTLRDIAKETGFSVNTASRVLNNKPDVSAETKRTILEAAKKMGYRPNKLARGLRSNKTQTVGVIVADIANPYFSALVKSLQENMRRYDYSIILEDTNEDYKQEEEAIQVMLSERVDGLIISPVQTGRETIIDLERSYLPFVLLGRHFDDLDTDYVTLDDVQGGMLATEHLIDQGHEHIALIDGPLQISSAQGRLKGYRNALKKHGLSICEPFLRTGAVTMLDGYRVATELLRVDPKPTAIFAFSDFVALGVMRAVREAGLRIPDDVAIVGYDDVGIAACLTVPLTTVSMPREEMGKRAVEILHEKISRKTDLHYHVKLPTRLVVRESTKSGCVSI